MTTEKEKYIAAIKKELDGAPLQVLRFVYFYIIRSQKYF